MDQEFYKAWVIQIIREGTKNVNGNSNNYQDLKLRLLDGPDKGKEISLENGGDRSLSASQKVSPNETVIISLNKTPKGAQYALYDMYRIDPLIIIACLFALLVLVTARWKGLGSILGLFISIAVIFFYIVPKILSGVDPLSTSILGSFVILFFTTYLAHGISKQTTVALVSTFLSLGLTTLLSLVFVSFSHLSGLTEETSSLQFGATANLNLQGLLLSGIIIGTLGALNDITTTQSAAVFELSKHVLSFKELFKRSFSIGREHIVSMINTLVLAYAGSAFALFIFLSLNPLKLPLWVIINSEDISDEIIRTIAGSMGLILVVPIVTFLACWIALEFKKK